MKRKWVKMKRQARSRPVRSSTDFVELRAGPNSSKLVPKLRIAHHKGATAQDQKIESQTPVSDAVGRRQTPGGRPVLDGEAQSEHCSLRRSSRPFSKLAPMLSIAYPKGASAQDQKLESQTQVSNRTKCSHRPPQHPLCR